MEHRLTLPASELRQALKAALLFTDSRGLTDCANICLHYPTGGTEATINALDGVGFYQQIIRCNQEKSSATWSLPLGSSTFSNIGQLLIPQDAAKTMVRLIPKVAKSIVHLEVASKPGAEPGSEAYHEVRLTYASNAYYTFRAEINDFPNYPHCLTQALENKDASTIPQGRAFPAKEFARIGKALAPDAVFRTYWPQKRDGICLLEWGENIRILYMPARWPADA